jgi:hypothetical protein
MNKHPEIDRFDFRDESTVGLFTQVPATLPPGLIMRRCIPHEDVEAMEAEAEFLTFEEMLEEERLYMKEPKSRQDMDENRIRAYRKFIEKKKPHWVGRIKEAMQVFRVDEEIVGFSGLPPYAGIAILENLKARGEVPESE